MKFSFLNPLSWHLTDYLPFCKPKIDSVYQTEVCCQFSYQICRSTLSMEMKKYTIRISKNQGLMYSFDDDYTAAIEPLICCFNFLTQELFSCHQIPVWAIHLMVVNIHAQPSFLYVAERSFIDILKIMGTLLSGTLHLRVPRREGQEFKDDVHGRQQRSVPLISHSFHIILK